ncbi:hypothetical protein, partial [Sphingomonas psychrolutea]|uniref:hypothetical protein n=1 Tax=Sphingomonas psychrolutea TaxID=1259676 RepID=UPI001E5E99B4
YPFQIHSIAESPLWANIIGGKPWVRDGDFRQGFGMVRISRMSIVIQMDHDPARSAHGDVDEDKGRAEARPHPLSRAEK